MTKSTFDAHSSEAALRWMLHQGMILRKTAKDPETFATVQGFILSDQLRDKIGSTVASLVAKATRKRKSKGRQCEHSRCLLDGQHGSATRNKPSITERR